MKLVLLTAVLSVTLSTAAIAGTLYLWDATHDPERVVVCIENGRVEPCPGTRRVIAVDPVPVAATFTTIRCPSYGMCLGTNGPDVMIGTDRPNNMIGRGGNDRMYGNGGNDILDGRTGSDSGYGYNGNDKFPMVDCNRDYAEGGNGTDSGTFDGTDTTVTVEYVSRVNCTR